jgi:general secretion pathway protein K
MRCQAGFALMLVIWALVLLSSLGVGYAYSVRHELRFASDTAARVRAEAAALTAFHVAVQALSTDDDERRWQPNQGPRRLSLADAEVELEIKSANSRIDLNAAPVELLAGLFRQLLPEDDADALADAVQDWRDRDDQPQPLGAEDAAYRVAGLPYTPANRPFASVHELSQVLGFGRDRVDALLPYLTVYSRQPRINAMGAELVVLAAIPGISQEAAAAFVAERTQALASDSQPDFRTLGNGRRFLDIQSADNTYSVQLTATTRDGLTWRERRVVRIQRGRGYEVLERDTRIADTQTYGDD